MGNKRKKTVAILRLCAAAIVLLLLPACSAAVGYKVSPRKSRAQAAVAGEEVKNPSGLLPERPPAKPPFSGTEEERKKLLFERLLNASLRFEKNADVSEFGISSAKQTGMSEHIRLYDEFLKAYPFVFHLTEDGSIAYNYKPENENELAKYMFDYRISADFENYYKKFEDSLEDFYGRLREGMSDAEIAYVLHNVLAEKTVYGFGMHASDTLGTVMKGRAICQGYSLIYRRLLLGAGINAEFISGPLPRDPSGHMWNCIQLDGNWYNLDLTWDDNKNAEGYARSFSLGKYFLTSDNVFYGVNGHPRPEADSIAKICTDTKYDSAGYIFRNGERKTEPLYHESFWYWISHTDRKIYRSRFDGTEKTVIIALKNREMRDFLYDKLELGKNNLYFIDSSGTEADKNSYIYSTAYDGSKLQKHEAVSLSEFSQKSAFSIVPGYDKLTVKKGRTALRGELMLSKMKDAYYHGTEDYFEPQDPQRKAFVEAIIQAEMLLTQSGAFEQDFEKAYGNLYALRKAHNMKRTCSPKE